MARQTIFLSLLAVALCGAAPSAPAPAPARWSSADARELLGFVDGIAAEGLDPADYQPDTLRRALATGDEQAAGDAATAIFLHLVTDLSQGHVRGTHRVASAIADPPIDRAAQRALLEEAIAQHRVASTLTSLLPDHDEYRALKAALAATPRENRAAILRLRANLERWRWLPRQLGQRYLLVNVPAFELQLVEDGKTVSRHRIVVGKAATATPQFSTTATGLILNPWWDVPQSIVAESVGRLVRTNPAAARARGYRWSSAGGRLHVRQGPGAGNALGQMKLVMPNPFTVYIHDTPSKPLFEEPVRTFSHGCIRTQNPFDLAEKLLAATPGWDRAAIERVVAGGKTTPVTFARPVAVYITYFTATTDGAGKVVAHTDVYRRDEAVVARLSDAPATGAGTH